MKTRFNPSQNVRLREQWAAFMKTLREDNGPAANIAAAKALQQSVEHEIDSLLQQQAASLLAGEAERISRASSTLVADAIRTERATLQRSVMGEAESTCADITAIVTKVTADNTENLERFLRRFMPDSDAARVQKLFVENARTTNATIRYHLAQAGWFPLRRGDG
jgi:hypothetical protein